MKMITESVYRRFMNCDVTISSTYAFDDGRFILYFDNHDMMDVMIPVCLTPFGSYYIMASDRFTSNSE